MSYFVILSHHVILSLPDRMSGHGDETANGQRFGAGCHVKARIMPKE